MTKAERMAEKYSNLWDADEVGLEWIPKKKIADLIHAVAERTREECIDSLFTWVITYGKQIDLHNIDIAKQRFAEAIRAVKWEEVEDDSKL